MQDICFYGDTQLIFNNIKKKEKKEEVKEPQKEEVKEPQKEEHSSKEQVSS